MIRSALQTIVAAFVAVIAGVGAVLCILLWKDDHRAPAFVLAVVLLAGCAGSVRLPDLPVSPTNIEYGTVVRWWNVEPMIPTTMHAYVHTMMEECLGLVGDFWAIRWFVADFVQRADDYERLGGIWIGDPPRIILDRRMANDPVTASHEMLHGLLGGGNADHDDPRLAYCEIKRLGPVVPR